MSPCAGGCGGLWGCGACPFSAVQAPRPPPRPGPPTPRCRSGLGQEFPEAGSRRKFLKCPVLLGLCWRQPRWRMGRV